jgi:hypothetical protein
MLHVSGYTREPPPRHNQEGDLGFIIDPERSEV